MSVRTPILTMSPEIFAAGALLALRDGMAGRAGERRRHENR